MLHVRLAALALTARPVPCLYACPRQRRAAADVIAAYHRPSVLSWSLWWMLAMCGIVAVEGYASSVWYALGDVPYYGYVDAAARLAAAGGALLPMLLAPTSEVAGVERPATLAWQEQTNAQLLRVGASGTHSAAACGSSRRRARWRWFTA